MPVSLAGRLLVATPMLNDPNFERTVVLVLEHSDDGAVGLVLNRPTELEFVGSVATWDRLAADPAVVFVGGPVSQTVLALGRQIDPTVEPGRRARGRRPPGPFGFGGGRNPGPERYGRSGAGPGGGRKEPDAGRTGQEGASERASEGVGNDDAFEELPPFTRIVGDIGLIDLSRADPHSIDIDLIRVYMGYAGWTAAQLDSEIDEGAWFVVECVAGDALTADPEALWHNVLSRQPGPMKWFARYPRDPSMN